MEPLPLSSLPTHFPPPPEDGEQGAQPVSIHQAQYTDKIASFFKIFNVLTGRQELYFGYIAGYLTGNSGYARQNGKKRAVEKVAVDFGCGTGWLTQKLPQFGFSAVYGIDTSKPMLQVAFSETARELTTDGIVRYHEKIPPGLEGKCDFITAVHVHYHFEPYPELVNRFFKPMAALLQEKGEIIMIGCPSDFIRNTPSHYYNSVHVNDIPEDVRGRASSLAVLADGNGYVPLSRLPPFPLQDGTQMKVTFVAREPTGHELTASVIDTYWSDRTLEKAAKEAGLKLIRKVNLASGDHQDAYMAMHFRKICPSARGAASHHL